MKKWFKKLSVIVAIVSAFAILFTSVSVFSEDGIIGSVVSRLQKNNLKEGVKFIMPLNEPEKDGFDFLGWQLVSVSSDKVYESGEEVIVDKAIADSSKTITFKPIWEKAHIAKQAVRLYGIKQDNWADVELNTPANSVDISDYKQVGLTFGPVTGKSYANTYTSHVSVDIDSVTANPEDINDLCLHELSWERIVYWSKTKPEVFQKCLETGCTHSVEIHVPKFLARPDDDKEFTSRDYAGWDVYEEYTGDGLGAYRYFLKEDFMRMTDGAGGLTAGWSGSKVRNTLNGVNTTYKDYYSPGPSAKNCLFSGYPKVLRENIVPKVVKSYNLPTDESKMNDLIVTYDKLWFLSASEYFYNYTGFGTSYTEPTAGDPDGIHYREGEGDVYKSQEYLDVIAGTTRMAIMSESGRLQTWSRTFAISSNGTKGVVTFGYNLGPCIYSPSWTFAIAPAFCLPGPDAE